MYNVYDVICTSYIKRIPYIAFFIVQIATIIMSDNIHSNVEKLCPRKIMQVYRPPITTIF
jgi:hypothetical protein